MFAHDHDYLSGMATVVLVLLMVIAMFWIRGHMPDDAEATEPTRQQIAADGTQPVPLHTAMSPDETGLRSLSE